MPELTRRYVVMTMAATAPFDPADQDAPFVLKPWKDPAALVALKSYRDHCYAELARDLDAWIAAIEAGPVVRGDVGRRNEGHLAAHGPSRSGPRRPRRSAKGRTARRRSGRSVKRPRAGGRAARSPKRKPRRR